MRQPRRSIDRVLRRTLSAAGLVLLLAGAALAQGYVMSEPPADLAPIGTGMLFQDFNLAPAPQAPPVAAEAAPNVRETPAAPPPAAVIRHLPNNIQGYRLIGEIGASEWPIFLTEAQSRSPLRFRVGYLASVSVMPEASNLTVSINDKVVGRTRISAPHGVKTAEFEIPAGLLHYGFNAIRIAVEQRHRVDCSLGATYELWTQIDPSETGLIVPPGDAGVEDLADLAALPADAQGALPIRAVIPRKTSLSNIENFIRVTQMIALIGRFEQPAVDFGPLAEGPNGINLVIGTDAELAAVPGLNYSGSLGPRVIVQAGNAARRTTVIVAGADTREVAQAIERFVHARAPRGSAQGTRAAAVFPGYQVEGGTRVRLRDLGVVSEQFSGRFFRAAVNITMPPDFYPADYAKMLISLDGGYASGLLPQSEIVVTVNERNAASLSLPRAAGDVFQRSEIPLPLGLLRPGLNRIEIQAQLPMQADRKCDPLAALEGKKRFLLLDSSEIILPPLARIARMPNLAVTSTGAFPFTDPGVRPKLFVPAPDRETMGAAVTLAARLAVSAGAPIAFQVTLTAPPVGTAPTLVVSSLRSVSPDIAAMSGLDVAALRDVWRARLDSPPRPHTTTSPIEAATRKRVILQKNFPASCGYSNRGLILQARTGADGASPETLRGSVPPRLRDGEAGRSLLEEWREDMRGRGRVAQVFVDARDWVSAKLDSALSETRRLTARWTASPEAAPVISARSSLVIAQNTFGGSTNDVWTFVLAPTPEALSEGVGCLIDPRVWRQVDGGVAALDASEGQLATVPAEKLRFISTQSPSLENYRLILASWLSLNQLIYVIVALLLAALLSGSTRWLLRGLGRRT